MPVDDWWSEALAPTQDEADGVVDVLLSVTEEPEWWSDVELASESPAISETDTTPWWLACEEDTNPFADATFSPTVKTPESPAPRPQQQSGASSGSGKLSRGPAQSSFNRLLQKSIVKKKKTAAQASPLDSMAEEMEEDNPFEEEAIQQVLRALPVTPRSTPPPATAAQSSSASVSLPPTQSSTPMTMASSSSSSSAAASSLSATAGGARVELIESPTKHPAHSGGASTSTTPANPSASSALPMPTPTARTAAPPPLSTSAPQAGAPTPPTKSAESQVVSSTGNGSASVLDGKDSSSAANTQNTSTPELPVIPDCFLVFSVERGDISRRHALAATRAVDSELRRFVEVVKKLATRGLDGRPQVLYGTLMDNSADVFDPLASIVKTARSRGVITTTPELLYQHTVVTLLCDVVPDADLGTYTFQQIREHSIRRQSRRSRSMKGERPQPLNKASVGAAAVPVPSLSSSVHASSPALNSTQVAGGPGAASGDAGLAQQLAMLDDAQAALSSLTAPSAAVSKTARVASRASVSRRTMDRRNSGVARWKKKPEEAVSLVNKLPDESPAIQRQLSVSVRRGTLSTTAAMAATRWVDKELRRLIAAIKSFGSAGAGGLVTITYGDLDRQAGSAFEPLSGVVKTAASRGIVELSSKLLLPRAVITLLKDDFPDSDLDTYSFQQVRQCSMRRPHAS